MEKKLIYLILFIFISCSNKKNGVEESNFGIPFLSKKKITNQNRTVAFHEEEELEDAPGHHQEVIKDLGIQNQSDLELEMLEAKNNQKNYDPNQEQFYTVKKYDTLMLISYKIYGDYEYWRKLLAWNSNLKSDGQIIHEGDQLKYFHIVKPNDWRPKGNPYLIKENETLGIISNNVYQTHIYWRDIWENNKVLIKDPNIIFAGFTIYTPLINNRDLAGQKNLN